MSNYESVISAVNKTTDSLTLNEIMRAVWLGVSNGSFPEDDAHKISLHVDERRRAIKPKPLMEKVKNLFRPTARPRSPDKERSRIRRRMLGGSGVMPDSIRGLYTEGERSVFAVYCFEVKKHGGYCDAPIGKIAALAGVSCTTTQNALRKARRLGHIDVRERPRTGRKSMTNIVRIVFAAWVTWIKRASYLPRLIGFKIESPLSTTETSIERNTGIPSQRAPPGITQA